VKGGAFEQVQVLPRQPRAVTRVNPVEAPKCSRECRPGANAGKAAVSGAGITAKAPDDSPG